MKDYIIEASIWGWQRFEVKARSEAHARKLWKNGEAGEPVRQEIVESEIEEITEVK